ncbi:tyrosine-type recombinase/integrase [Paracoccus sp. CPCC 101403]|uniref:Tyrosine-type recombinase/integrase n=2 Tax=Paracoccus broussonetiae TaxID=3075834 RepID=A0ABU3EAA1_9RHOB|nr:tyrosine-type recombinase/integrase [Paracoccus sp. CPCC 101403]MDT1061153.1 tyrosine-type recombinase/integrase [Paracoccus sp. CPCC 101403]
MLRGIRRQKRGERIVRYHRATGVRLPDDIPETHPDFVTAWAMAEASAKTMPKPAKTMGAKGTIAYAVMRMKAAPSWGEVSANYRKRLTRHGDQIAQSYGTVRIKIVTRRNIEDDIARLTPDVGNERLKAWRWLFKQAMDDGETVADPSQGIRKRTTKSEGFLVWTDEDVAAFRARWKIGTVARACFELVCWTGARTNDAVTLSRSHIGSDGVLTFRQSKTGGLAHVPWTCALPEWAEAWSAERDQVMQALQCLSGGFTFLEVNGRVRGFKGLGKIIASGARSCGLAEKTAHGLRKYRLTAIAEAGGSTHALMAWGGHKTLEEVAHYTRAAEMKRLISGTEQKRTGVSTRS